MATIYEQVQPLIAGQAYTFYAFVISQADTDIFQTTVTLAEGDVTLFRDGALVGNLTNLPAEVGTTGFLSITLTTAETTGATKFMTVKLHDVAGGEWQDVAFILPVQQVVTVSDVTTVQVNAECDTALADYDAPTKAEMDAGLAALNDPTVAQIATRVWANDTRTLTQSAAQIVDVVSGSTITVQRLTSWSISLTGLGSLAGRTKLYFTVKSKTDDTDAESIFQVEETAGLLYLDGAAASDPTDATLTVDDETLGNITITANVDVTTMAAQIAEYDVKMVTVNTVIQKTANTFKIASVITRAVA